jgi:N-acetyl-alpha-D-muramate 1-phosphate uridylyltransferase
MTQRPETDAVTGSSAMVLAAGLGRRMHPLTLDRPKPLVEVAGKPLIDYAFDHLRRAGIKRAVVNVHYLAEQLVRWAEAQTTPEVIVSDERRDLLDTGGGIVKALPHLGRQPFFVLNSDSFWVDGKTPALQKLRLAWNASQMDCLLLLCPLAASVGYGGTGDFHMLGDGRLARKQPGAPAPFIYAGGFLVSPRLFAGAPRGAFSINLLWDEAQAKGRLFGVPHDGLWIHVGTPESIAYAEEAMKKYRL